jgi:hypothetical protein
LQAAGLTLEKVGEPLIVPLAKAPGSKNLCLRSYTFASLRGPRHVFFGVWEDAGVRPVDFWEKPANRLDFVRERRRSQARRSIQLVARGYPDLATAREAARGILAGILVVEPYERSFRGPRFNAENQ